MNQPISEQNSDLPSISELRGLVVAVAREELLPRFAEVERTHKRDGSVLTAADLAVQSRLQRQLARRWPAYQMLGEEMAETEQRQLLAANGEGLWVLDPLDGTSNFAAGLPFFSVSLALMIEGRVELGLIYDPMRDECFSARRGAGAFLNLTQRLQTRPSGLPLARCIAAVDFKRLAPELAARLAAQPPYSSQRSLGSVALDWCWVAAERFHVYLHGRQKLWDYAAGSLILEEAGGCALTLDGESVFCVDVAPRSAVAALDVTLFDEWAAWLGISRGPATAKES